MAKVNFMAGTLARYNLSAKDANTLYFLTDVKKIYKGDVDVTEAVVVVTGFGPQAGQIEPANAVEGKLYIDATNFEIRVKNGAGWTIISPGKISDGTNMANSENDGKFATVKAIREYVLAQIAAGAFVKGVSFDSNKQALLIDNGSEPKKEVPLTGMAYRPTYDAGTLTLTIPVVGEEPLTVNFPKDNFVRNGYYDANHDLPEGGTGPAIVLVVDVDDDPETKTKEIVIPAASLVDVYTGENSQNIKVEVSAENKIKATAIISTDAGNALVSTAKGLLVDVSDKASKLTAAANGHILVGSATGDLADSGVSIEKKADDNTADNKILVTKLVMAEAITAAVQGAQDTLSARLDALEAKFTEVIAGHENEIITATNDGNLKVSGFKAGGSKLAEVDSAAAAKILATEAAVTDMLSWQSI